MRLFWRFFLFGTYALLLIAALLYVRFPTESFRVYAEQWLQTRFPAWDAVQLGRIDFLPPLALAITDFRLTGSIDGEPSTIQIDSMEVAFTGWPLTRNIAVQATLYNGQLHADLTYVPDNGDLQMTDIRLIALDPALFLKGLGMVERELTGLVDGQGTYQANWSDIWSGQGEMQLVFGSGQVGLLQPLLSLNTIRYERLAVGIDITGTELQLREGELRGGEIDFAFSGMLSLTTPLPESELMLRGELNPGATYLETNRREQILVERLRKRYNRQDLPFQVGGTLARPTFRFGGG